MQKTRLTWMKKACLGSPVLVGLSLFMLVLIPAKGFTFNDVDAAALFTIDFPSPFGSDYNTINGSGHEIYPGAFKNIISGENHIVYGDDNAVSGLNNKVEGFSNAVSGEHNEIFGENHAVSGEYNGVGGVNNEVSGQDNQVGGYSNAVSGKGNTVRYWFDTRFDTYEPSRYNFVGGRENWVSGDDNFAFGNGNVVTGQGNFAAIGATVSGTNNIGLGAGAVSTGMDSISIGNGAMSTATGSVAIGKGSIADEDNTVAVGASGAERRIVHVADGVVATDAATLGQLSRVEASLQADINSEAATRNAADRALQNKIDAEALYRAAADADLQQRIEQEKEARTAREQELQGSIDQNEIQLHSLEERTMVNEGDIAHLESMIDCDDNGEVLNASAIGPGSTSLGHGASAKTMDTAVGFKSTVTADGSVAVGANSTVESENSVAVGADSQIANGANGSSVLGQNASVATGAEGSVAIGQNSVANEANTVSVGSNTNQRRITNVADGLKETDAVNLRQLVTVEKSLKNEINDTNQRMDDLGALAMAIAQISPNSRSQGNTQVSVGVGHYEGSNAVAAGMFHYINDNVFLRASVSTTFDETGAGAGITIGW